jgi:hypothetical protein
MKINYFKDKDIPVLTNVEFILWDMVNIKKYLLTAGGGNIFVPEGGIIPKQGQFHLGVCEKEFEDAVLELAKEIKIKREVPGGMYDIKFPQVESSENILRMEISEQKDLIVKLIGIIKKLVEK